MDLMPYLPHRLLRLTILGTILFISAGFCLAQAPIIQPGATDQLYSNPLPQVLILTAIVVGVSTTALGLAIVVRIKEAYGSIEEHEIFEEDRT